MREFVRGANGELLEVTSEFAARFEAMAHHEPTITRVEAPPSAWTFKSKPIRKLLDRYVGDGKGWVDPFAGKFSPAEFTNDFDPEMPTRWHMDAVEFARRLPVWHGPLFKGVLFDPPYSYRQITEHYKKVGLKASQIDTSSNFYNRVMNALCDAIEPGGLAISFGWNSSGFGKRRGFGIVEMMLVNHGQSHHNDTIVTVERKRADGS